MGKAAYDGLNSPPRLDRAVPVRSKDLPMAFVPPQDRLFGTYGGIAAAVESETLHSINER